MIIWFDLNIKWMMSLKRRLIVDTFISFKIIFAESDISIDAFSQTDISFFKWAKPGLFCLYLFFSHDKYSKNLTIHFNSVDGVLGTQTRGGRMVGTDESTENMYLLLCVQFNRSSTVC